MIDGSALSARALGDAARRDLAVEWAGPEPAAPQTPLSLPREAGRRLIVRKP
ncbi:MAG TPA: hypothetical protein VJM13_07965 [Sphingopyxis sp.]|nr:hypothetical protein [Sphingopyxis sp.]